MAAMGNGTHSCHVGYPAGVATLPDSPLPLQQSNMHFKSWPLALLSRLARLEVTPTWQ